MMKVVVIGGVAAGMSMASKLKRLNKQIEIHVYERGEDLSYGACGMPYYLSDLIPKEASLIAKTKDDFENEGIHVHTLHDVIDVDEEKQTIDVKHLGKTQKVAYDVLVIGSGASPIRLPVKNRDLENIMVLNSLEDARQLKKTLQDPLMRNVAIVGGGYIGLEVAENLLEMKKQVRIIERMERLLLPFDPFMGEAARKELESHGVEVHLNEEVQDYEGESKAHAVITDQGKYPVDLIIEAVGIRPNTDFVKNTSIKRLKNGAIITNDKMETHVKNIYAAGDCASYRHVLTNEPTYIALGTHANKAGRVIAEQIAGNDERFTGVVGSTVLKVCDLELAKTGLSENELTKADITYKSVSIKARDKAGYYPNANRIDITLHYNPENGQLLGAQMVGKSGVAHRINTMAIAISKGMTAKEFSQLDLAYAPPFSPVYDPLQIATNQIKCK